MSGETLAEFARPLGRRERVDLADTPIYVEVSDDHREWQMARKPDPKPKRRRWWWFW